MKRLKLEEKLKKETIKNRKKFIKSYIKALFKTENIRQSQKITSVLEDVCYQLYTYGEIMHLGVIKANKDFSFTDQEIEVEDEENN